MVRSARVAGTAAVLFSLGVGVFLGRDWQRALLSDGRVVRKLAAALLAGVAPAYLVAFAAAVLGAAILSFMTWQSRQDRQQNGRSKSRPRACRWLLLCASWVLGTGVAEVGAAVWLKWLHRLPAWPRSSALTARSADELVIAVIGGSSARGVPYDSWLSVGEIVARELQKVFPAQHFRVDVLAENGATLEAMHQKLASLNRRPDVLIVYSGHNEFLARFPPENRVAYYDDELPRARGETWWHRVCQLSPFLTLLRENLAKERVGVIPARGLSTMETIVGRPVCTQAEADALMVNFQVRLDAIVATCIRIGCLPVLIVPPGNDASDPTQSYTTAATPAEARHALFGRLTEIRAIECGDRASAIAAYRKLVTRHPTHALLHYRLARLLERDGEFVEAQRHYVLARDHDGLAWRSISALEAAYRAVANRYANSVVLVDGPVVLRAKTPHGILDDHLFHDNVHPTLGGHVVLAEAVLAGLKARRALAWPRETPAPVLDSRRCAADFGFRPQDWAVVCERTAAVYGELAFLTADSAERISWRDRYALAAQQIRAGIRPELVGIPAVGFSRECPDTTPR